MGPAPFSSMRFLRAAIKAVPSVKWALGIAGVMAALALGKTYFTSTVEAVVGTLAMLALMVLLVVFAAVSKAGTSALRLPSLALAWIMLALFVVSAALTVTAAFFSWPRSFADLIRVFVPTSEGDSPVNSQEIVLPRQSSVNPDSLPAQVLLPVRREMDETSRIKELAKKGSLTLDANTFTVGPIGGRISLTIAVHTLTLIHGSRIVTNGNTLTIQAVRIVGGGSIVSFLPETLTLASAPPGASGPSGHDGGTVFIDAIKGIDGNLEVDLSGQNGGDGGPGASGSAGPAGARGSDAVQGLLDCHSGGGDGSKGGMGSPGRPGGGGGNGGNGGELTLSKALAAQASQIHFKSRGGSPGLGGIGGPGGPGGPGGQGGSGSGMCSGGNPGPQGDPGPAGAFGAKGTPGNQGQITTQK